MQSSAKLKWFRDNHPDHVWVYLPPKWYNLKYRGGSFVIVHPFFRISAEHRIAEAECLRSINLMRLDGKADWEIYYSADSSHYEITFVYFVDKTDALNFKLTWV